MLSRSTAASRSALARASSTGSSLLALPASTSSCAASSSCTASSSRLYSVASRAPSSSSSPAGAGAGAGRPQAVSAAASAPPQQRSLNPAPTPQAVREWFAKALPSLPPLPDDVAAQIITHDSWDLGLTGGVNSGHSRRLSFIGE